jgi:hypothetical protein
VNHPPRPVAQLQRLPSFEGRLALHHPLLLLQQLLLPFLRVALQLKRQAQALNTVQEFAKLHIKARSDLLLRQGAGLCYWQV